MDGSVRVALVFVSVCSTKTVFDKLYSHTGFFDKDMTQEPAVAVLVACYWVDLKRDGLASS